MSFDGIKLFVFDLDGTFYEQKKVKSLVIKKFIFQLSSLSKYNKARKLLVGKKFDSHNELVSETSKLMGKNSNHWILNKFYPRFYNSFTKLEAHPLANEVLNHLRKNHIKIAVVSDYGNVKERLVQLNINIDLIDFMYGTETDGALKPNTFIGEKIQNQFNFKSEQIIYIGDRVDTDQAIAKAMGSAFFGITFENGKPAGFNDWSYLKKMVDKQFQN
jgi:FMN phosphatase YigB (HAD superfamily)